MAAADPQSSPGESRLLTLERTLLERSPSEAAKAVADESPSDVAAVLVAAGPAVAVDVLEAMPDERREAVLGAAPADVAAQWRLNRGHADGTVGRLMEAPTAVFRPDTTVGAVVDELESIVRRAFVTYAFVTEADGRLVGLLTFRDLLFAPRERRASDVMLRDPFTLRPDMRIADAMTEVVVRHFPVYPVTDASGRLVGQVRGQTLFQRQAFEISAQPGRMVGVEKEERISTPWWKSLRSRHPWLQLNLLTAFVAAAVVGVFQGTLDRLVLLAAFLPVLAGQSGNTGCQALAVALRGMTLGDMSGAGRTRRAITKEAVLGLLNGVLVGATAGTAMYFYARAQGTASPLTLGFVVMLSMTGACVTSGVCGVTIPVILKRLGADPATASSIFLTTATDVVSMGLFLGLATVLVT